MCVCVSSAVNYLCLVTRTDLICVAQQFGDQRNPNLPVELPSLTLSPEVRSYFHHQSKDCANNTFFSTVCLQPQGSIQNSNQQRRGGISIMRHILAAAAKWAFRMDIVHFSQPRAHKREATLVSLSCLLKREVSC